MPLDWNATMTTAQALGLRIRDAIRAGAAAPTLDGGEEAALVAAANAAVAAGANPITCLMALQQAPKHVNGGAFEVGAGLGG
ncbi:MAG: hypothetical protein ACYDBY_15235 [Thermoanaerobaculia bacterium]